MSRTFQPEAVVSAKWGLPFLKASGFGNPEDQWNLALKMLDAFLLRKVKSFTLTSPPGSPAEGDVYYVAATATGAWAGYDNHLAVYIDSAWRFTGEAVSSGLCLYDETASKFVALTTTASATRAELVDVTDTPTSVALMSLTVSDPPTLAQINTIKAKINELADALGDLALINPV